MLYDENTLIQYIDTCTLHSGIHNHLLHWDIRKEMKQNHNYDLYVYIIAKEIAYQALQIQIIGLTD